jgi:ribosomal protein S18 acetylase RimI-like enzyme
MRMRIRVMTIADYDRVYALWMACRNMGFNNLDDSREGIEKYLKRNPNTCFVALEGGALAGVILSGHDGRRGFIHHMAVAEAYRHRGIGTALVDAALSALRTEGIHKVALLVFRYNEAGNAFWEKMGFAVREDLNYRNRALSQMKRIDT